MPHITPQEIKTLAIVVLFYLVLTGALWIYTIYEGMLAELKEWFDQGEK